MKVRGRDGPNGVNNPWIAVGGTKEFVQKRFVTLDGGVFGGHVRDDGRREHAQGLEQSGFGVRHVRLVVETDRTVAAGHPVGLVPDGLGHARVDGQ